MKGNGENRGQVAVRGADIRRLLADDDAGVAPALPWQTKRRPNSRIHSRSSREACFCHGPCPPSEARQFDEVVLGD